MSGIQAPLPNSRLYPYPNPITTEGVKLLVEVPNGQAKEDTDAGLPQRVHIDINPPKEGVPSG